MASLIPGYEYDIFISYRHNDNRSGWVTEFVSALQEELSVSIKEPVTLYFDTNPHDGLLENNNVDKSLEIKLKCLVFIPIVSQTYCDPKCFAWQNEFCVFNNMAREDEFGTDIILANGNVTSRILPIKIHAIDNEDATLLESELDGELRAIEFIHKATGVNRPLTSRDDEVRMSGKILYLDQVNKVANSIHEILKGIKSKKNSTISNESPISQSRKLPFRETLARRNVLRASLVYILTAIVFWKVIYISSDLLNLTEKIIKLVTLMLIVLFPFAMLMAWLYERSPEGFIRTGSVASLENPYRDEQKKPFTSITFISLLLVTNVTLFLVFPLMNGTQSMKGPIDVEKSIAILPFVNDSPDQGNAYFINGIMEEILDNLQKVENFRVVSRASTEEFRGTAMPTIPEISKKLAVNFIVVGSGQKYGNTFRLRVELISAKNEQYLWGESYEQEIENTKDIFKIQSQIAQAIATELKATITPE